MRLLDNGYSLKLKIIFVLKVVHFKKVICILQKYLMNNFCFVKNWNGVRHHSAAQCDFLSCWDEILFESVSNRSAFHHMIGRSVSKLDPFQQYIGNTLKKREFLLITVWNFRWYKIFCSSDNLKMTSWHERMSATKLFKTTR